MATYNLEDHVGDDRSLPFDSDKLAIAPGEHLLIVDKNYKAHIRCVGGGGGGGGCSDRSGPYNTGGGGGGAAGVCTMTVVNVLDKGAYKLVVGAGGRGGKSTDDEPPEAGQDGGKTYLQSMTSTLRYASADGGAGGIANRDRPQAGADSHDQNGDALAAGGKEGGWQKSGQPGQRPGAGGGGCGHQGGDYPDLHGGAGGDGALSIWLIAAV